MKIFLCAFLIVGCLVSCKNNSATEDDLEWNNELSTKYNKLNAQEEEIDIKLYLARKPSWKMIKTGSGLQYYIYNEKEGELAKVGDHIEAQFKIELLDGDIVEETKSDEVVEFKVDHAQIETGIQEAVKYMKEGERAKLIIPSHLAHGVVGDLSKIPPLSVLVVDMYIHRINR